MERVTHDQSQKERMDQSISQRRFVRRLQTDYVSSCKCIEAVLYDFKMIINVY